MFKITTAKVGKNIYNLSCEKKGFICSFVQKKGSKNKPEKSESGYFQGIDGNGTERKGNGQNGRDDKTVTFLCVYLSYGANPQNHDRILYTFQIST